MTIRTVTTDHPRTNYLFVWVRKQNESFHSNNSESAETALCRNDSCHVKNPV